MTETFRDIIGLFDDRADLADRWRAKLPAHLQSRLTTDAVNMWHHRDSVPGWSWAAFEAAAKDLAQPSVTMTRLVAADMEARRLRAVAREQDRAAS